MKKVLIIMCAFICIGLTPIKANAQQYKQPKVCIGDGCDAQKPHVDIQDDFMYIKVGRYLDYTLDYILETPISYSDTKPIIGTPTFIFGPYFLSQVGARSYALVGGRISSKTYNSDGTVSLTYSFKVEVDGMSSEELKINYVVY